MKYSYRAINEEGNVIQKTIEAHSEQEVVSFLKGNGLIPIQVKALAPALSSLVQLQKVGFNDVVNFTRQMSMMLTAGLTIVDAFSILKRQETKPQLIALYTTIESEIKAGNKFSDGLKKFPHLFSNLYIALIRSGEASGKLNAIMSELADNLEEQRSFMSKVRGALVYPAFIIVAILIVMLILMTFVVPQMLKLFQDFDVALPLTTQIVITISNFLSVGWPVVVILGIAGFYGIRNIFRTPAGKHYLDKKLLTLPVIGKIITMAALVNATKTLAILTKSGVSILISLQIVQEATTNSIYQDAFGRIQKKVEKGTTLGDAMEQEDMFPPLLVQMTTVGEQTGNLDETLLKVSRYFEAESQIAIKAFSALIEPTILIVLGVMVGFLVTAVISPIYTLTTSIK